jgi:FkbM family methyltransferase
MKKVNAVVPGPSGKCASRDIYTDAHKLLGLLKINHPVIVDGGACIGSTIKRFLEKRPNADIHAFEARPDLANTLTKTFAHTKNVKIYNKALGKCNSKIKFNVTKYIGTGSVLIPSAQAKRYNGSKAAVVRSIRIDCVRLDQVISHVDLIKLDVQGSELDALHGSTKLFGKVKLLIVEVMFYAAYNKQPLFCDINSFLGKHAFQLFNIYGMSTHKHGKLTFGNALYINTKFYNKF